MDYGCRGTSIKTRIETTILLKIVVAIPVAEEHPLKQGLKLPMWANTKLLLAGCRGTSIKTRIETLSVLRKLQHHKVAEEHPLKQGLKHHVFPNIPKLYSWLQRNIH